MVCVVIQEKVRGPTSNQEVIVRLDLQPKKLAQFSLGSYPILNFILVQCIYFVSAPAINFPLVLECLFLVYLDKPL